MNIEELVRFYESLTPADVARFPEFYADNAFFKDPFNEVSGIEAIQHIFSHMFRQVGNPRFVVDERIVSANGTMLVWRFHFRIRSLRREPLTLRGVSHLKFDSDGKVNFHRDYWDAAEELYMKLPGLCLLMRGLQKALGSR
jgi:steroid delta-isomerase